VFSKRFVAYSISLGDGRKSASARSATEGEKTFIEFLKKLQKFFSACTP
jgi:hypothetical protein